MKKEKNDIGIDTAKLKEISKTTVNDKLKQSIADKVKSINKPISK